MIKEIKYGGYTGSPSDYECMDGDLAMSVNMVPEKSALHMVMPPEQLFILPQYHSVMCLHDMTGNTNYIIKDSNAKKLFYLKESDIPAASNRPLSSGDVSTALTNNGLIWEYGANGNTRTVDSIQPVGNTLVVLASDGIHYILWKATGYVYLGQKVPELKIGFGLKSELTCYPKDKPSGSGHADPAHIRHWVDHNDLVAPHLGPSGAWIKPKDVVWTPGEDFQDAWDYNLEGNEAGNKCVGFWTNLALGKVNRLIHDFGTKKGKFVFPFFVRWGYELYDGSVVMHGDPVLLVPNSKYPFFAMRGYQGMDLQDATNDNRWYQFYGRAYGFVASLQAKILNSNASDVLTALSTTWKDIVRRVNLYVSAPVYTYNQDGKVYGWQNMDDSGAWDEYFTEGEMTVSGTTKCKQWALEDVFPVWNAASDGGSGQLSDRYFYNYDSDHTMPSYIFTMPEKNDEDRLREIETGSFYSIKSYEIGSTELSALTSSFQDVSLTDGVLESLVARETMKDDYHSRDIIKAGRSFAYNGRLNISGITRVLHNPLAPDLSWARNDSTSRSWTVKVEFKSGETTCIIASESGDVGCAMPRYVFYPDRNAKTMWITYASGGTTHKWRLSLTEHPNLEGAYWYGGLGATLSVTEIADDIPTTSGSEVKELSKIYTSEVNNPFVFPLLGINTVGTGEVMGICSAVKALSQGQFGQFPLYAFTTEGVWALQSNGSGGYSAVQPVTRDVCISAESITQMDDSVLFATDRGVMIISGSTSVCMSEAIDTEKPFAVSSLPGLSTYLSGSNSTDSAVPSASVGSVLTGIVTTAPSLAAFRTFLAGCRMLYDYTLQRVYVYNPSYTYSYVYSLDTKKWGMAQNSMKYGINAYPEAQAVIDGTGGGIVVNMSTTAWTKSVQGLLITRPLKLDAPDALKTIDTIIQRGYFDTHNSETVSGTAVHVRNVRQILYGSRDMFNWYRVFSSADEYLRGFCGSPYKYFRIVAIVNLKETESIVSGTIKYTPRLMNQPR